jgi:hypothetical protein
MAALALELHNAARSGLARCQRPAHDFIFPNCGTDRHGAGSAVRPSENDVLAPKRDLENVVDELNHSLPLNATRQHVSEAPTWVRFKIYDPLKRSFTGLSHRRWPE